MESCRKNLSGRFVVLISHLGINTNQLVGNFCRELQITLSACDPQWLLEASIPTCSPCPWDLPASNMFLSWEPPRHFRSIWPKNHSNNFWLSLSKTSFSLCIFSICHWTFCIFPWPARKGPWASIQRDPAEAAFFALKRAGEMGAAGKLIGKFSQPAYFAIAIKPSTNVGFNPARFELEIPHETQQVLLLDEWFRWYAIQLMDISPR